jgi:hypothetical protein
MGRKVELEAQVAVAPEASPGQLPFLPELLADLDELGTDGEAVLPRAYAREA